MTRTTWFLFPLSVAMLTVACTKASFYGGGRGGSRDLATNSPSNNGPSPAPDLPLDQRAIPGPESNPSSPPSGPNPPGGPGGSPSLPNSPVTPGVPTCKPGQVKTGTQISFLIDNSNSNASTDCPAAKKIGSFGGVDTFECGEETSREKAVLAVYDLLKEFGAGEPADGLASSVVGVTSFPTVDDYVSGYKIQSPFVAAKGENRPQLEKALKFARKPFGLTPYLAAMSSAEDMMKSAANDKRSKVVILVTDGEPTDRSAKSVAVKADSLRASGIKVVSVYYNGGMSRSARNATHLSMMTRFEEAYLSRPEGHWYDQGQFGSFDSYARYLVGDAESPSLLMRMTSKEDPACQDAAGTICPRKSYEVGNAEELKKAFLDIVTTQAIGCGS